MNKNTLFIIPLFLLGNVLLGQNVFSKFRSPQETGRKLKANLATKVTNRKQAALQEISSLKLSQTQALKKGKSHVLDYIPSRLKSIYELPMGKVRGLKQKVSGVLENKEKMLSMSRPDAFGDTHIRMNNQNIIGCNNEEPDSTREESDEALESLYLNYEKNWYITDDYGLNWYELEEVRGFDSENTQFTLYPVPNRQVAIHVKKGGTYQVSLWYKTAQASLPYMSEQKPGFLSKVSRYLPYVTAITSGYLLSQQTNSSGSEAGSQSSKVATLATVNIGSLVMAGRQQSKRVRHMKAGKRESGLINYGSQSPSIRIEELDETGKIIESREVLLTESNNWMPVQISEKVTNTKSRYLKVSLYESANRRVITEGYNVKAIERLNAQERASRTSERRKKDGGVQNKEKADSFQIGNQTDKLPKELSTLLSVSKGKILNPFEEIKLEQIKNKFTGKLETVISGMSLGKLKEEVVSKVKGITKLNMEINLLESIGDKGLHLNLKNVVSDQVGKKLTIGQIDLKEFELSTGNLINSYKSNLETKLQDHKQSVFSKSLSKVPDLKISEIQGKLTSDYEGLLKKIAKEKGYKYLELEGKQINLTEGKIK